MKNNKYSVYATNKGGKIACPKGTPKNEPRVLKTVGQDMRIKKG